MGLNFFLEVGNITARYDVGVLKINITCSFKNLAEIIIGTAVTRMQAVLNIFVILRRCRAKIEALSFDCAIDGSILLRRKLEIPNPNRNIRY